MINITIERKHVYLLAAIVTMAALLVPASAWASNRFNDVPDSNIFHDDIDFIADRSITLGCGDGNYCPDDFVTREQLAAFMERSTRVATPTIVKVAGPVPEGTGVDGRCITPAYTPEYEEQVLLLASAWTSVKTSGATVTRLAAGLEYRESNGGSFGPWQQLSGSLMVDSVSPSSVVDEYMSVSTQDAHVLSPGATYEFAIYATNHSGQEGKCNLVAVYMNRMP